MINERIKYKVLPHTYKSLKTGQPSYLRSLILFIVVLGILLLSPLVTLLSPLVLNSKWILLSLCSCFMELSLI